MAVAQSSEAAPTVAVAAQQEMVRKVTEELLALPEPYRSTMFNCRIDGLAPEVVARRLGLATATVEARLREALRLVGASVASGDPDPTKRGERRARPR